MRYELYRSRWGRQWRWRLRAANNRIIAVSGEGYHNKADAERAIELVQASTIATVEEKS